VISKNLLNRWTRPGRVLEFLFEYPDPIFTPPPPRGKKPNTRPHTGIDVVQKHARDLCEGDEGKEEE